MLIVDESIRGDHLSLNGYHRDTTPYLLTLSQTHELHNWGIAASGATCSKLSNLLLLTGAPLEPDIHLQLPSYPTLFQYARAMGYHTTYINVQTNYLWNGMIASDLNYVDDWINRDDLGSVPLERDFVAAALIRDRVSQTQGNFIMLNKQGVHFIYDDTYPPSEAVWLPTPTEGTQEFWFKGFAQSNYFTHPDRVINAYDNGVLYNVNTFFETLLPPELTFENTVFIYTSDHGESFLEDGHSSVHCHGIQLEASVPLVLINTIEDTHFNTTFPASHHNIFATILDFMAVPDSIKTHQYTDSLLDEVDGPPSPRYFFDGIQTLNPFDIVN